MSNFGHYAAAILCPPLYFFMRGRSVAGVLHLINYLVALPMLLVFGFGVFMWFVGAAHAAWDLGARVREETIQRQAEVMAEKLTASQKDGA